jgi:hypothetical protein
MSMHVCHDWLGIACPVVLLSELFENADEGSVFFLHFLVMAAALFGFTGPHESFHGLEDLIHPAHVLV